ncbi:ring-1,2-phenylacetyl-CoA epoxidase subunit PaaC [Plasticicumulans lactativorans]|uniref:Ring-1,2-phenylacetyl-CoA epoxidase subunit PaaC n=1 Tax=Plasticicumulans lactativorans TaxID=1133106 RepID=A0A4R2LCZ1_9GAMM|nr:1,2-phenylacetyl-CoA epoxidase subunit PaaC [Plasticicumulans lactativorans]TCO80718.1 ring-1,2-phenylacetyl-CoA epoxidase subunit PaaC [Plasticicumulans lactativorans]
MSEAKIEYLLRLGDSALILGQRVSEWIGHAPIMEEDVALANVALDLIGQARLWFGYAGELEGRGRDEDALAFLREAHEYRNVLLVEQPNGNFADTLVRQFLFDAWHHALLEGLSQSHDPRIAEIAVKALKEVTYHLERSSDWVVRLGDGTEESHRKAQAALDELWTYTGELFAADAIDAELVAQGVAVDPASLREAWLHTVQAVCEAATLTAPPADAWMQSGGKQGRHTEHLGYILAEMQSLPRAHPGARW